MSKSSSAAAGSSSSNGLLVLHPWPSTSTEKPRGGSSSTSARARPCIYLSAEFMKARKIQTGSPIVIAADHVDTLDSQSHDWCLGAAWPSFSLVGNAVSLHPDLALPSKFLSSVGGQVKMRGAPGARANTLPAATSVKLRIASDNAQVKINTESRRLLAFVAKERMVEKHFIRELDSIVLEHQQQRLVLRVVSLRQDTEDSIRLSCGSISRATTVTFTASVEATVPKTSQNGGHDDPNPAPLPSPVKPYNLIGGLDKQIDEIRSLVEIPLLQPELFDAYGLKPPRGVLLFGPPGTGKTSLARAVAASTRSAVVVINGPELSSAFHGETEAKLRNVFDEAKRKSPCIVIIDEIDALAPRREAGGGVGMEGSAGEGAGEVERRVVATLLTLLDGVDLPSAQSQSAEHDEDDEDDRGGLSFQKKRPRVVVIAATNRPNAIDPALRRPGRLDREIEIGIPTSEARAAILSVQLRGVPHSLTTADIELVANKAHGYVGADLGALVREAGMRSIEKDFKSQSWRPERPDRPDEAPLEDTFSQINLNGEVKSNGSNLMTERRLKVEDLLDAMSSVKASALREIAFETPKVHWSDIACGEGAGAQVQARLRESVEWPLQHPEAFVRLGVDPPKGVLLYGPPGCSKTLMARALATESGLNFIAVKGPELFNKFVGESERAVRETFRKARAAKPCIVFFDEIDALTTTRGADGESGGGSSDRVIGTLLNEMDGVGTSAGVVVIAATNRPEVIDPALLRPGRFDRLLYVAPPDRSTRLQMLQHRSKRMSLATDVDLGFVADLTEGCSGAEVVSVCQDAGLAAMSRSLEASEVGAQDFAQATKGIKRRITPVMLLKYEQWRDSMT